MPQPKLLSRSGRFDSASWAHVYEFEPKDAKTLNEKGRVFGFFRIKILDNENLVEPQEYGKNLINLVHNNYFGTVDSAFESFEKTMRFLEEASSDRIKLDAALFVVLEKKIHIGVINDYEIFVQRGDKILKLLTGSSKSVTASGFVIENDKYFAAISNTIDLSKENLSVQMNPLGYLDETENILSDISQSYSFGVLDFGQEADLITRSDVDFPVEDVENVKKHSKLQLIKQALLERKVKVKEESLEESSRSKKTSLLVGVIVIVLLFVSIAFGLIQKRKQDKEDAYLQRLVVAEESYNESLNLFEISKSQSRDKFIEGKNIAYELLEEGVSDERLVSLVDQMTANEGKIMGVFDVEVEIYTDLTLLSDNFGSKDSSFSQGNLYVLSRQGDRVARVEIPSKRSEIVFGPQRIRNAEKIAAFGNKVFYLDSDGVHDLSGNARIQERYWQSEPLFSSYAGNLYLVDKATSTVYRHSAVSGGYAQASTWTKDTNTNLTSAVSVALDGEIWILDNSGQIFRFSLGNRNNFSIRDLETNLSEPVDLFTNEETSGLYVLDPNNSRVIVIDKGGGFISSYKNEMFSNATKIFVSEESRLLLILVSDKIYSTELRHLSI